MPTVFIIGRDWMFRTAVRAQLREQGVEALGFESLAAACAALESGSVPAVIVLDHTSADPDAASLRALERKAQVVGIASGLEDPASFSAGERLLRKPVQVAAIIEAVRHCLEGHPV